jgi:UDP-N-acetylglucosamine 2-epimerase (non-hydrolysing)
MKLLHVVGARPNFMKVAPVMRALALRPEVTQLLMHTGQHYDAKMSDVFFDQLGIPRPDINLEVGSGSHAVQTAQIMTRCEPVLQEHRPDFVLVCAKLLVPVAHVEAGLRSRDRTMPEEINRLVTDQLSDLLFTPSSDGDDNLLAEGIGREKIKLVGNVMIDTLVRLLPEARKLWPALQQENQLDRYALLTLHRPSNVDDPDKLVRIMTRIAALSARLPILFPIHPRTLQSLRSTGFQAPPTLQLAQPLGYLEFLALQEHAAVVITDSGGIQEETTYLGVPCLTMRENTERPVTVTIGTNLLVGNDLDTLEHEFDAIVAGRGKRGALPPLWDGHASERIAGVLLGTGTR